MEHLTTLLNNYAALIKESSLNFSSPRHFSDVVLVVEDTKFHVHKCILSMWSPVFETMFTSQFMESNAKEIPLPGKRADEMEVLLKYIYSSGTKATVTEENYQFLLQLADEYQMDRVKSSCSKFLVNKIEVSNCLDFFKLAEKFGLYGVKKKCYEEVQYNSSADLEGSEHFVGFEPELKVDICMRVIKELERTLREYVTTCSDLVQKVYKNVYESFYCGIQESTPLAGISAFGAPTPSFTNWQPQFTLNKEEHIQKHIELQTKFKKSLSKARESEEYNTQSFEFSCSHCIKRVINPGKMWNGSYSILKEPVNKLYDLQQNNKVAAREAKKIMVDKPKEQKSDYPPTWF